MKVTLLGFTQVNHHWPYHIEIDMMDRLLMKGYTQAESITEFAARICTRTTDKMGSKPEFIQARIGQGHDGILEHVHFTFLIEGISRVTSHQLVRHRIATYDQESQRRCLPLGFVIPPSIEEDPEARVILMDLIDHSREAYVKLRGRGIKKEDARYALTGAEDTRLVATWNASTIRHIANVRIDGAAQWEIRAMAQEALRLATQVAPKIFEDLNEDAD